MRIWLLLPLIFLGQDSRAECRPWHWEFYKNIPEWKIFGRTPELEKSAPRAPDSVVQYTPVSRVKAGPPTAADYRARFRQHGFEIVQGLPKLRGMTEAELLAELKRIYGEGGHEFVIGPNGKWYRKIEQRKDFVERDIHRAVLVLEPAKLPPAFMEFVEARLKYLERRFQNSEQLPVGSVFEVRVGDYEGFKNTRGFHFDGEFPGMPAAGLVETLNRDEHSRGTYVRGVFGNIFEPKPGEAVLFSGSSGAIPTLHSAPPQDGQRIFTRYAVPVGSRRSANSAIFLDAAGNPITK